MRNFLSELRRRNVWRIAAAYALSSWILIEAGSVLLPTFGASERFFRIFVVLVIAGFVAAVILAWIFEWTPEGVRVDRRQEPATVPAGRQAPHRMNYAIIALLAVALTVSISLNLTENSADDPAAAPRSLAVLPFESRGGEPDNALFADGIHDDLLTRLANIKSLKVISRTSVMEYRNTRLNLRQIGEELGAETILEGSVQRIGDNVRINLQLIDATTDEHLWAQAYDRRLTLENIFSIQSEISEAVAAALETTLSPDEQRRVTSMPTKDLRAYRLHKEGRQNLHRRQLETLRLARQQFAEAVALDPAYAEAHAGLAESVLLLWNNHRAIAEDEAFAATGASLERALELDPNLADAYAILGLLKHMQWQNDRTGVENAAAEAAFRRAIELNPNHASAWMWFASLRNEEERLDEAIELYQRAMELDPLARIPYANLPLIYAKRGQDRAAMHLWLEAARIHSDWPTIYQYIAVHLWGLGRLDEAYAWYLEGTELTDDPMAGGTDVGILADLGEIGKAEAVVDAFPDTHLFAPAMPGYKALFAGEYGQAQEHFVTLIEQGVIPGKFLYNLASDAALLAGDFDVASRYALAADPLLNGDSADTVDRQTARNAVKLAYIHLRQGRKQEANRLLNQALEAIADLPRLGTFGFGIRDVQIYSLLGRREDALNAFREALDAGFRGSVMFDGWPLALDPYLDQIRDEPRFQQMVAELDRDVAIMRNRLLEAEATGDFESLRARAEAI
ncbi:MAG TPA: tetratricopeptide repeat protein [Woeseiaceae bacterium]|nr:tetratricopeptide repeat protein [Woeseiaceae bacterium]